MRERIAGASRCWPAGAARRHVRRPCTIRCGMTPCRACVRLTEASPRRMLLRDEEAIMLEHRGKYVLALALLTAAGCATYPERDAVVEDARFSVYAARNNPQVVTYAPIEIDQAVMTLRDADDLAARGGSLIEVRRLAQLAQ